MTQTRVIFGHPDYPAKYLDIKEYPPTVVACSSPPITLPVVTREPLPAPRVGWWTRVWRRIWG